MLVMVIAIEMIVGGVVCNGDEIVDAVVKMAGLQMSKSRPLNSRKVSHTQANTNTNMQMKALEMGRQHNATNPNNPNTQTHNTLSSQRDHGD